MKKEFPAHAVLLGAGAVVFFVAGVVNQLKIYADHDMAVKLMALPEITKKMADMDEATFCAATKRREVGTVNMDGKRYTVFLDNANCAARQGNNVPALMTFVGPNLNRRLMVNVSPKAADPS